MHTDPTQFVSGACREADGATSRIRKGGAIIGLARIADVVIGDVGSIYGLSTTTAGGYNEETEGQHHGQQGTDAHRRKLISRTKTVSTDFSILQGENERSGKPFAALNKPSRCEL
jgi:hypothetical protein